MHERSEAERRAIWPCLSLAKGAKRSSHTTNTIKFDCIPFDLCNSIKRFNLCPFDQNNSTYLQPPIKVVVPRETSRASGTGKTMMSVLFDNFTTTAKVFLANFRAQAKGYGDAQLLICSETSDRDFCLLQHSAKRNQRGLGKRSIV